jgi:hypothetical protein
MTADDWPLVIASITEGDDGMAQVRKSSGNWSASSPSLAELLPDLLGTSVQ